MARREWGYLRSALSRLPWWVLPLLFGIAFLQWRRHSPDQQPAPVYKIPCNYYKTQADCDYAAQMFRRELATQGQTP